MFIVKNVVCKVLLAEFVGTCRSHAKFQRLIHLKSSLFPGKIKQNTESGGPLCLFVNYKKEIVEEVTYYWYLLVFDVIVWC
jgi:hypothetical protein